MRRRRFHCILFLTIVFVFAVNFFYAGVSSHDDDDDDDNNGNKKRLVPVSADFLTLMKERRSLLQWRCGEMRDSDEERFSYNFHNLFVLESRSVVWCPVFKASSSNWMSNLFEMSSLSEVCMHESTPLYIQV